MQRYAFRLFVSDAGGIDQAAIANVQRLCASHLQRDYEITVVDVSRQPELAEQDRILATPTLLKVEPQPRQSVVGDLADIEEVLRALSLWEPAGGDGSSEAGSIKPR